MDDEYLRDCIENEVESSCFDFKKDIYDFSIPKSKQDFLEDVISFANSHIDGDKYIITGVKLYPDGKRDFCGITESKIKDGADYQSIINDNIEPNVIIDFKIIDYLGNNYGIFRINKENKDQPYLLSKQYEKLSKGFIKIRKGQKNEYISRRDLDLYYNNKLNKELSEIKLRGIADKKSDDKFEVKLYECNINFEELEKDIYNKFVELYNYELEVSIGRLSLGDYVKFEKEDIQNIKEYAEKNDMPITEDFFNIGGLKAWNLGAGMSSGYSGTDSEKRKYELICTLEKIIGIYHGLKAFYEKLTTIYYSELIIENIGKKYDEEIEVDLKIRNEDFFDFESFPLPNEFIIEKFFDKGLINKFLENKKISGVNNYTAIKELLEPTEPSSYSIPGMIGCFNPEYDSYVDYYQDCIDYIANYDITVDEKYTYIRFEQKSIRANEKVFLPSRLLFKNIPEFIEYEIKSKHNPNIQKGKINCFTNKNS